MSRRPARAALALALAASAVALPAFAQSPSLPASPAAPASSIPAGPAITVIAQDYAFVGLPSSVPAGTALGLQNDGVEVHELLVARRNDGVTETWDELMALPEDQVGDKVTIMGPLVALPGEAGANPETGEATIVLTQEGEYIALCFVPQGMTAIPDASMAPDASFGPPHAFLGMRQEFTVTAADSSPGPVPSPMPMGSPAPSPAA